MIRCGWCIVVEGSQESRLLFCRHYQQLVVIMFEPGWPPFTDQAMARRPSSSQITTIRRYFIRYLFCRRTERASSGDNWPYAMTTTFRRSSGLFEILILWRREFQPGRGLATSITRLGCHLRPPTTMHWLISYISILFNTAGTLRNPRVDRRRRLDRSELRRV
jgi:hypothetical protein